VVVAHGLGCQLLAEALGAPEGSAEKSAFPGAGLRCFFVAPDVKPSRFLRRVAAFPSNSGRTLYCDAHDALWWPDGDATGDDIIPRRWSDFGTFVTVEAELEDGWAPDAILRLFQIQCKSLTSASQACWNEQNSTGCCPIIVLLDHGVQ
jgi:hypothetical protein